MDVLGGMVREPEERARTGNQFWRFQGTLGRAQQSLCQEIYDPKTGTFLRLDTLLTPPAEHPACIGLRSGATA